MEEQEIKSIAQQLRKPEGDAGKQIATFMNTGNEFMNRAALSHLQLQANDRILEIGMGNGFFVKDILAIADNIHYCGCDYSPLMVEEARLKNAVTVENKNAEFIFSSADKLPYFTGHFDKILCINTFYFWENPLNELTEIKRVLKIEGLFILAIRPDHILRKTPVTKYGFHIRSQSEVIQLCSDSGFKVKSIHPYVESRQIFFENEIMMESLVIVFEKETQ